MLVLEVLMMEFSPLLPKSCGWLEREEGELVHYQKVLIFTLYFYPIRGDF